jgi:hypothetical protein
MKKASGKIHFIHQMERAYVPANQGDWISSPYLYFKSFFENYTCIMHSVWSILWHEIERDDFVIYGGGGLLDNSNALNDILNRLMEECDNVIIWGAGSHKYTEEFIASCIDGTTEVELAKIPINYEKALLLGIRDFNHPSKLPFLPCVSCLHPAFDKLFLNAHRVKRKVGAIKHGLDKNFEVRNFPYSMSSNASPIGGIVQYIMESSVMLSSTYHGVYWSILLGRPVLAPASRRGIEKYLYLPRQIGFFEDDHDYDEENILRLCGGLAEYPPFLEEARALNWSFFKQVKNRIESCMPAPPYSDTLEILAKRVAQLEYTILELSRRLI